MLTQSELDRFIGTIEWHTLSPLHGEMLCSDGIAYMAEHGAAYWLVDLIAAQQINEPFASTRFQVWSITNTADNGAVIVCEDGDCKRIYEHDLSLSTFPLNHLKMYVEDSHMEQGRVKILMLPSER